MPEYTLGEFSFRFFSFRWHYMLQHPITASDELVHDVVAGFRGVCHGEDGVYRFSDVLRFIPKTVGFEEDYRYDIAKALFVLGKMLAYGVCRLESIEVTTDKATVEVTAVEPSQSSSTSFTNRPQ